MTSRNTNSEEGYTFLLYGGSLSTMIYNELKEYNCRNSINTTAFFLTIFHLTKITKLLVPQDLINDPLKNQHYENLSIKNNFIF